MATNPKSDHIKGNTNPKDDGGNHINGIQLLIQTGWLQNKQVNVHQIESNQPKRNLDDNFLTSVRFLVYNSLSKFKHCI